MQEETIYLRRYTSLPILLDILIKRRITLLNPLSWEDRNDSFYVEKYKEIRNLKTVLALCFTSRPEQFHHWKVFAAGSSGVCIRFHQSNFVESLRRYKGIKISPVQYRLMRILKENPPPIDDLPFIKRIHYEDEGEYRVIYENRNKNFASKDIPIDINSISRITLSPWMPVTIAKTIKEMIKDLPECNSIQIIKAGMIDNTKWKNIANGLA